MLDRQLTLENIACVRGGRLLFKDISCALGPGDATLVRGPNGTGKSSLLRLIAGLLTPYAGTISRIGSLALADEAHALDPRLPLRRALGFWAAIDSSDNGMVDEAMGAMRISHLATVPVRMLSTGQKKRATLARVIASRADIWLLDEPGNGLDKESLTLLDAAMAVHRVRGGIIMAASHQPLGLSDVKTIAIGEG
jgi:heme exporter protein A